jgi:hypothetical protein
VSACTLRAAVRTTAIAHATGLRSSSLLEQLILPRFVECEQRPVELKQQSVKFEQLVLELAQQQLEQQPVELEQ